MRKLLDDSGQSTTEFLAAFIFAIVIILVFLKIAINLVNGYVVHYAVYNASRTYLVWDNFSNTPANSDQAAWKAAQATFLAYPLDKIIPELDVSKLTRIPPTFSNPVFTGIWIEWETPFGVSKMIGGIQPVKYRSESFLGREPSVSQCLKKVCDAMADVDPSQNACDIHTTAFDNGC